MSYTAKKLELERLVTEAYFERRDQYPRSARSVHGPAFSPTGFQTYHIEALVDVLRNTDALELLYFELLGYDA